jgi:hypothetical protein
MLVILQVHYLILFNPSFFHSISYAILLLMNANFQWEVEVLVYRSFDVTIHMLDVTL